MLQIQFHRRQVCSGQLSFIAGKSSATVLIAALCPAIYYRVLVSFANVQKIVIVQIYIFVLSRLICSTTFGLGIICMVKPDCLYNFEHPRVCSLQTACSWQPAFRITRKFYPLPLKTRLCLFVIGCLGHGVCRLLDTFVYSTFFHTLKVGMSELYIIY